MILHSNEKDMSLSVYVGPMFSGKTTHLVREITQYSDLSDKRRALIINHSLDNRNAISVISSHSSSYKGLSEKVDVVSTDNLSKVDVTSYEIVGIDEANFFTYNDLISTVKNWLVAGKHVICSGLDGDSDMNKFGYVADLLSISDRFVKLTAICSVCITELTARNETITPCNVTPAPFTKKIAGGSSLIDIGGADKYQAVCRKHHH